ncbi:MAG: hypothetical protein K0S23_537 [Fluviicola sp.]|jgi:hypothetical protein|nr:hypothetical protein [Fluviicola sp.]
MVCLCLAEKCDEFGYYFPRISQKVQIFNHKEHEAHEGFIHVVIGVLMTLDTHRLFISRR